MTKSQTNGELIAPEGVTIVHSPVSDLGDLRELAARSAVAVHWVELGMGDAGNRERFHALRESTGLGTLPQCFVDGRFVGGLLDGRAHLLANRARPPLAAALAGYGGLIPFFACAAGLWVNALGAYWVLTAYAAVILSFIGAVHWGIALCGARREPLAFAASVVPALLGWIALLLSPVPALALLLVAFGAWRLYELAGGWPAPPPLWFKRLRTHLTVGVGAALVAAIAALLYG